MNIDSFEEIFDISSKKLVRKHPDTFTTYQVKQSSSSKPFFTDRSLNQNRNVSLQDKYEKQQCQECIRCDHIIDFEC